MTVTAPRDRCVHVFTCSVHVFTCSLLSMLAPDRALRMAPPDHVLHMAPPDYVLRMAAPGHVRMAAPGHVLRMALPAPSMIAVIIISAANTSGRCVHGDGNDWASSYWRIGGKPTRPALGTRTQFRDHETAQ